MWRALLEPLLLFASPFILYAFYLGFRQRYPFETEHWTRNAISTLTLAGLAVAAAGMLAIGIWAPRHKGTYVPAHIEDGRIVPGHTR